MSHTNIIIYIVDDDQGHCELVTRSLRRGGIKNELRVFHEAPKAFDSLKDAAATDPILTLLDINMPGAYNGMELLQKIKQDATLKHTPIVMLTTTEDPREIKHCYDLGCNAYITKPIDVQAFNDVVKKLGLFLGVVKVANGHAQP